uniref:Uncharacterized protein n=1 Tax=Cacopsylla melanoneura TaxID=428564 RepID=A0A8D8MBG6_9HEMI
MHCWTKRQQCRFFFKFHHFANLELFFSIFPFHRNRVDLHDKTERSKLAKWCNFPNTHIFSEIRWQPWNFETFRQPFRIFVLMIACCLACAIPFCCSWVLRVCLFFLHIPTVYFHFHC